MTAIVCDICKKAVGGARRDINYFTILDKDICEACHDELRDTVKAQMRTHQSYSFKDYQDGLAKNLQAKTR
jgi:hypothetical protein